MIVNKVFFILMTCSAVLCTQSDLQCETDNVGIICHFDEHVKSENNAIIVTSIVSKLNASSGDIKYVREVEIALKDHSNLMPRHFAKHFKAITTLTIHNSSLSEICREDFHEMKQVEMLNLFWNQIVIIEKDTLYDLKELRHLDLAGNKIVILYENLLINNHKLRLFDASCNEIEIVHRNMFANNFKISKINFYKNKIVKFEVDLSSNNFEKNFMNVTEIDLRENAGKCDLKFMQSDVTLLNNYRSPGAFLSLETNLDFLSMDIDRYCNTKD
jgi:Leucine-rich repeat (LRR) protein